MSSSRRKSRKAHFAAHSTARHKIMSASLSKELQQKYKVRAVPVVQGDEVAIVRGSNKGVDAKVRVVYRKKFVLHLEGVEVMKANKQPVAKGIHPSNCIIKHLNLMSKSRLRMIERMSKDNQTGKGKVSDSDIARVD